MPRTKGSKNKNINTAKNKNIININVNSSKSKRGRPRKTTANTNTQNRPPTSGGSFGMAPPQVIITQPPADNSNNNSLLSSFITSKMLNETMNLNRSNITNVEPSRIEQPSYFNARESIIPKLPETPAKTEIQKELKPPKEIKPAVIKQKELTPYESQYQQARTTGFSNMSASQKKKYEKASQKDKDEFEEQIKDRFDDMYNGSTIISQTLKEVKKKDDLMQKVREQTALLKKKKHEKEYEDKIHKGLNESAAAYEREISKLEEQVSGVKKKIIKPKQQSTTDFLNMSFTPPKKDIVQMLTPSKEGQTTAIIPYKGQQSTLDFLIGGTPQKTSQQLKTEKQIARIKELKHSPKIKDIFEYNDLKTEITNQPNPNKEIASGILSSAIKSRKARKELVNKKIDKSIKQQSLGVLSSAIKSRRARKDYKTAQDTYDPRIHQEKIRDKRKEYTRIITTQSTTPQAKEEAQKKFKKTNFLFERKSNAGRPPANPYTGLKQTEI